MTVILVGSGALEIWRLNRRDPVDRDYWSDDASISIGGVDVKTHPTHLLDMIPTENYAATPDAIYTIKCSHAGWDVHWEKTKADILWLKSKGCQIIPELYDALIERWKEVHGDKSFLSLNKSKEQFFTDMVDYKYDHDYLHELVAYPHQPVYGGVLKGGEAVAIDKSKFDLLPFEQQVKMFREEIAVIACERWLLNDHWKGKVSWYQAYMWSLKKTITNLTKNWATDFIVLNLECFIKPNYEYFEHLLMTLKEENIMSKVDLSVFEESKTERNYTDSMQEFVYAMCEGDLGWSYATLGIEYPERDGRAWRDPSYQEEKEAFQEEYDVRKEEAESNLKYPYKHLDQEGGGEGGSEYCYGVFKLGDKVYKAEYSYYSYNGHEIDYILDTLKEVVPVEKTITVYE